jgi:hypothetical protein
MVDPQTSIALIPVEDASPDFPRTSGSVAVPVEDPLVTLRFRLTSADPISLEALRYARRAMLREESTRGLEEGEASLEEASFSAFEIVWRVPDGQRERCLRILEELVARANLALDELRRQPPDSVPGGARMSPGARIRR